MKQLTAYVPPIVADILGVVFLMMITPALLQQFSDKVFVNSVIIGAFFAVFCAAVILIRRLQNDDTGIDLKRYKWWLAGISSLLVFFIAWATADTVGFLDSVLYINNERLDEMGAALYLMITPASWLMVGFLYSAFLAGDMQQTTKPGTGKFLMYATLGLTGINLMIAVVMAYWGVLWERWQPAGNPISYLLWLIPLFILLYAPPRFVYSARSPRLLPLLSFLALLTFYAWQLANGNL